MSPLLDLAYLLCETISSLNASYHCKVSVDTAHGE